MRLRLSALLLTVWTWCGSVSTQSQDLPSQAVAVVQARCLQCHNESAAMSGLQMVTREQLLKGGSRGPAIKPGDASGSLLFQAVMHSGKLVMPPAGKLNESEVGTLRAWIDQGAAWPGNMKKTQSDWWAFCKPSRPKVPGAPGAHPVDAFLWEKLRIAHIEPAPEADRLTLLRRACFDLHGLPPTPEQVAAFLSDTAPGSWERLLDSLLSSPRYGEKWGRHWLDLVRYGDTSGFEQDPYTLEAWRYRDYVIKSLNDDKPYDKFVKEQLAGDEIWPDDPEARTGTGYFRVGPNRDMLFKVEDLNRVEKLTDAVDTTSTVFLGLTTGCARCHDHKFDPIPQRDFYRMQAIFTPAVSDRVFLEYNMARFYDIAVNSREFKLRQIGEAIDRIQKPYREKSRQEKISRLPADAQAAIALAAEKRTPEQQALVTNSEAALKVSDDEIRTALTPADATKLHEIEKRLVAMFANYTSPPMAPGIIDVGREAPRTYIAVRGNPEVPGEEVRPGFLSVLGGGDIPDPPLHARTTGRRKALAEWLASSENPLFARVMMNRVWQYHFGQGLVKTPSDFGVRSGLPSHPELLDWLAAEFSERKWSLKAMHKLLMTSEAYRRSSVVPKGAHEQDPANVLLSHMSRRRLQAEEIRDSVLQVSGALNLKTGGMPVVPPLEAEELFGLIGKPENAWVVSDNAEEHYRRSIYLLSRRTFQQPMFEAFDSPDGILSCSRRNESTTAPQSLALLNSSFMQDQSRILASKVQSVEEAWRRVLLREPSIPESTAAAEFLERQTKHLGSKPAAMTELARGLMNLNEFLYVD
jgi:uncharacterized protein DUF1553/uncharacterized protein DUF1549/cytochrome c